MLDQEIYEEICSEFDVPAHEVVRPNKIELLLSNRSLQLLPDSVQKIGNMGLWSGPLGKCLSGFDSRLRIQPLQKIYTSVQPLNLNIKEEAEAQFNSYSSHAIISSSSFFTRVTDSLFASAETELTDSFLECTLPVCTSSNVSKIEQNLCQMFREESIGVDTTPRCGDCKCGNCSGMNKSMSLKNERLYELFRSNMVYDEKGTQDNPGPYWRSKLPFLIDRHELSDNKRQVLAVMKSTGRRLNKKEGWRSVYET